MTRPPPPAIVALVAAAPRVDADGRADALTEATRLRDRTGGVLLGTCHRVELYARLASTSDQVTPTSGPFERVEGEAAARHVIELAVGLRSAVLAEDQLIHQLRTAVASARRHGPLGRDLETLLDVALRAGRMARSWRPATRGEARSLADLAIERIRRAHGQLDDRRVLIVGTGVMGRAISTAAVGTGADVLVTSPTEAHARAEGARIGAASWPFDPGPRLVGIDAVVIALAGPWRLGAAGRRALAGVPIVVDLSMPSALVGDLRAALEDRLVDIDGIASRDVATVGADAARYRSRLERLARASVEVYLESVARRARSGVDRLAVRVERERSAELAAYLRRQPEVTPEMRRHLEDVTRRLSRRMFREPLRRLADDPDGRRRQAFDELFGA